jgi:hypothetical protein
LLASSCGFFTASVKPRNSNLKTLYLYFARSGDRLILSIAVDQFFLTASASVPALNISTSPRL